MKALINSVLELDKEAEYLKSRRKYFLVRFPHKERFISRKLVQLVRDRLTHQERKWVPPRMNLPNCYTVLSGFVQMDLGGRSVTASKVFSGDSFREALLKAKAENATNIERIF